MSSLLSIFLEIRRQILISGTVEVTFFPVRFHQFDRSVAYMFAVHLLQTPQKVISILKRNKSITSTLACASVSDHSGHLKWREPSKDTWQDLVVDLVTEVAAKYSVIIFRPILHSLVLPDFSCCLSQSVLFYFLFLLLLLYLFTILRFAVPFPFVLVFFFLFIIIRGSFLIFHFLRFDLFFCFWLRVIDVFVFKHHVELIIKLFNFLFFWQLDRLL